jgi:hypothetical protein
MAQGKSQEVNFTSEPPGAEFTVAGQTATTPAKLLLPKEDYRIVFRRPGFREASFELKRSMSNWFIGSLILGVVASTIDLATGAWQEFDTTDIHVTLEALPGDVEELKVTIGSEPPGAEILIGEAVYGRTPKDLFLPWKKDEREKNVTFRLERYVAKTLALGRGDRDLRGVLEPEPVTFAVRFVSRPEGAEVRVDGKLAGKAPLSSNVVFRPQDPPKKVEFSLEGHQPEKRDLRADQKELTVELKEIVEIVPLALKVIPAGAKVSVDGKPVGDLSKPIPLGWSLSQATHKLTVSQPGYATRMVDVRRSEAASPLEIRLVPSLPGDR